MALEPDGEEEGIWRNEGKAGYGEEKRKRSL